jgi:hypothetical protein
MNTSNSPSPISPTTSSGTPRKKQIPSNIMKNILCVLGAWAFSIGFLSPLFAQDTPSPKAVPGGLSSKKGSGKIFPPNSKLLQVAGHDAYLALPKGAENGKAGGKTPWLWYCPSDYKLPGKLEQWMMHISTNQKVHKSEGHK